MARNIIGAAFVSLDGVMQAPGGPTEDPTGGFAHGGWLPQFFDDEVGKAIDAVFNRKYDLLLGRRTYEIFAAYWPYIDGNTKGMGETFEKAGADDGAAQAIAMGETFTRATKYVLTRGHPELPWSNSQRVGGVDELRTIKAGDGPDIVIQGSSTIYPALIEAGLIDRLTVMTFPVLLGGGKRLFGDGTPARTLKLVEQRTTPSGAVIATYEPGGDVGQRWAGPEIVTDRELARRTKMEDGSW